MGTDDRKMISVPFFMAEVASHRILLFGSLLVYERNAVAGQCFFASENGLLL